MVGDVGFVIRKKTPISTTVTAAAKGNTSTIVLSTKQTPTASRRFKVKTGCITCRIRKVKCDEGRPSCNRCTDTGRKCDGYVQPSPYTVAKQSWVHTAAPKSSLVRTISAMSDPALPNEELRWLDFFCRHTAPGLSGIFDDDFWTSLLPQISHSERAVRHALLAVSSSHAHFQSVQLGENSSKPYVMSARNFGLRQYNKAIAELKARLKSSTDSTQVALVCCLLFICIECIYGNRNLVLDHLGNGLQILNTAKCGNRSLGVLLQKLRRIFDRLAGQSVLFGMTPSETLEIRAILEPALTQGVPQRFQNIQEAKSVLDPIISSTLTFVKAAYTPRAAPYEPGQLESCQMDLYCKLLAWHRAYTASSFQIFPASGSTSLEDKRDPLIRTQYLGTMIWLQACLNPTQVVFDSFTKEFEDIVALAEMVIEVPTSNLSLPESLTWTRPSIFALDQGLIPALYLTSIKCRHPVIRRRALDLMDTIPGREGLWDTKIHARVARRVVEIEEEELSLAGIDVMLLDENCIPECHRVRDIDFSGDEEDSSSYQITFYTLPHGFQGDWKIWEERVYAWPYKQAPK